MNKAAIAVSFLSFSLCSCVAETDSHNQRSQRIPGTAKKAEFLKNKSFKYSQIDIAVAEESAVAIQTKPPVDEVQKGPAVDDIIDLPPQNTDPVFAPPEDTDPVFVPPPFDDDVDFEVPQRHCSAVTSAIVGSSIKTAEAVIIRLFPVAGGGPVLTIDDALVSEQLLYGMRQRHILPYVFSGIPNGNYHLLLCDKKYTDTCNMSSVWVYDYFGKPWFTPFQTYDSGVIGFRAHSKFVNGNLTKGNDPIQSEWSWVTTIQPGDKLSSNGGYPHFFTLYDGTADKYGNFGGDESECHRVESPLIIDMTNEGIELSSPADGVDFDITATGMKTRISWPVSPGSMFLVLDKNQNNSIDDANEMFGNNTRGPSGVQAANGFEALREYDDNLDGMIGI